MKEMATQLQELLAEKKSALARLGAKRAPSGFIEMQKTSDQINRLLANKAHEITRQDVEDLTSRLGKIAGRGWKSQRELRAGFRAMNEGYTHRRQDLPVDVQRMLGKIEAAPYLVAKGTAVQQMDVYKARLFKTIADNPEWVRTKVRGGAEIPANFRKVDDERFGSLAGKYVRKDVWEDLREVNEWRGAFVRDWDKLLSLWKMGKVVYNPATHARNFMNNTILAYYGDVLPGDPVYIRAANQLRKKGRYYQEAKEWGLYNNSFVKAELYQLRDSLDEIRDPRALKTWIRKGIAKPSELYQANEHFFKTVVYIKARQSGMDVDAAARKAEKFLFNYGDIPPWVKHAKRWGAPFLTFTYKALPLAAEMTVKKPWKTAAIIAAMYGMEEFARHSLGETKEEAAKERSLLPEWQRSKLGVVAGPYVHVKMPFQDKWGNNLYLDLAYILPYGDTGEKWGQSGLPFGKVLPSHPFFDLMYSWGLNRDPFTGKDIHTPELDQAFGETWAAYWTKHLDYAWKALAPPLAPGAHNFDKLKTGFQNSFMDKDVRDWADRPVQFSTAVMSTLMGIKLTPANEEKLKQYEMWHRRNLSRAVGTEIGKLRYKLRRKEIDQAEFKKRARKLLELKRTLLLERPKP